MKYLPIGLIVVLSSVGCKSWDGSMITAAKDPIHPKLLTLDARMDDGTHATVIFHGTGVDQGAVIATTMRQQGDDFKLFTSEVEDNLMDPFGSKYGSITFRRHVIESRFGAGQLVLSTLLFTIPNLFGFPFATVRHTVEVELRVMDREGRLVGKYAAIGSSKVRSAYYHGYSLGNAMRKANADALNDAFAKIRPRIQDDAARVNRLLMEAGKL
jgi:hypothetical protein